MTRNWSDYEGETIGDWRLDSFLGDRGGKAFFITHRGADPKPLLIQLMERDLEGADAALASWNLARDFNHEHLLRPYASGEGIVRGQGAHFVVLDLPDDDLGEVLSKRRLGRSEAKRTVATIGSALDYLHGRGLSHGAVTPSNVFFLPDGIRLSVDTIRPASDGGTDSRELENLRAQLGVSSSTVGYRKGVMIGAGVVAVLLVLFLWVWRAPAPAPAPEPKPVAKVKQPVEASTVPAVKQTPLGPPINQPRAAKADRGTLSRSSPGTSWGVVAAAYRDSASAEKFGIGLGKRVPQLRPHVSPPSTPGKMYLVVLGSGLTQDGAEELRARAISLGAPRDAYVTKLDEH